MCTRETSAVPERRARMRERSAHQTQKRLHGLAVGALT